MSPEHRSGCLVCGEALEYLSASAPMTCALCGGGRDSAARCVAGHFVCDACHAAPAKDVIERACAVTDERDPVALAERLMHHPALKLHGPEHHFLVPAVLLAAARFSREHLGVDLPARAPTSTWSEANRECLGEGCPFHPRA